MRLLSGEVHFWRMDPDDWEPALRAVQAEGIPIVATYLSWRRHSPTPGELDLEGRSDPRLDVRRFLQLCSRHGLLVHLKPGPWICAEEPNGGYPDWLLSDSELWALDASNRPISGYDPPFKHPVPSYLHPRYLAHVWDWLTNVDSYLKDYFYPQGPVCLVQLDNEPSYAFQDGMYGADYNPVTLAEFRRWVLKRYGSLAAVGAAWDTEVSNEDAIEPPRAPSTREEALPGSGRWRREHDWVEFKEWLLAEYLRRLRQCHVSSGASGVVFTVNYNTHPVMTVPQDPRQLTAAANGVGGEDLYYIPKLGWEHLCHLAQTAALARAAGEIAPWAPEIQAGIWRSPGRQVDYPDPTVEEQTFYYLAAVAFGLGGFNFYMLVQRENWDFSPLRPNGAPTPMVRSVRSAVSLLKRMPKREALCPRSPVALVWHRPYARDAYAAFGIPGYTTSTGTSTRSRPYRAWLEAWTPLLRAGYVPAIWDTSQGSLPHGTQVVVLPSGDYLPLDIQLRLVSLAEGGVHVVILGDPPHLDADGSPCLLLAQALASGTEGLHRVGDAGDLPTVIAGTGVVPPAASDHPGVLCTVMHGDGKEILFVLHWGNGPAEVAVRLAHLRVGRLVPVLPGGRTVLVRDAAATLHLEPLTVSAYYLQARDQESE